MKNLEKIKEILNKYTEPQNMDYYLHGCIMNEQFDDLATELVKKLTLTDVSFELPDHYAGKLNTHRIKAYRLLHEQYNLEEGTVRNIFCKGADWYKEQCQNGNVC